MNPRLMTMAIAFFALTWLVVAQTMAADAVEGTIESAGSGKISIKDKNGTVRRFEVDSAAKITLDGKEAKLDALGVGSTATITTESKNNKTVAVMIEALSKMSNSNG